jgi:hypothetical protein
MKISQKRKCSSGLGVPAPSSKTGHQPTTWTNGPAQPWPRRKPHWFGACQWDGCGRCKRDRCAKKKKDGNVTADTVRADKEKNFASNEGSSKQKHDSGVNCTRKRSDLTWQINNQAALVTRFHNSTREQDRSLIAFSTMFIVSNCTEMGDSRHTKRTPTRDIKQGG